MSSKKIVYKTEESVEVITGKKQKAPKDKKVKPIKPPFIREVEKYGNLKKKAKKDMTETLNV